MYIGEKYIQKYFTCMNNRPHTKNNHDLFSFFQNQFVRNEGSTSLRQKYLLLQTRFIINMKFYIGGKLYIFGNY